MAKWLDGTLDVNEAVEKMQKRQKELLTFNDLKRKEEVCQTSTELYAHLLNARTAILTSELNSTRNELSSHLKVIEKLKESNECLKSQALKTSQENLKLKADKLALSIILSEEQKSELNLEQDETNVDLQEMIISKREWEKLHGELMKVSSVLGVSSDADVVGGDRFKIVQNELREAVDRIKDYQRQEEKMMEELSKESELRKTVETEWNARAEDHRVQNEKLQEDVLKSQEMLEHFELNYSNFQKACRKDLTTLTADRERIVRELKRLQDENDNLMGKYQMKSEQLQNELINLPEKMDDIHMYLLRYREELISAKLAKERIEEKYSSEISFVKAQLTGEQQAKESIEDQLTAEIDQLKERIVMLESCKSELEAEQKRSKEYVDSQIRDRQANANLQNQMESHILEKRALERQINEYSARVKNLQQELDNSVAVQTDFVRLSQSLQVELEKIRQSEKEVLNYFSFRADRSDN